MTDPTAYQLGLKVYLSNTTQVKKVGRTRSLVPDQLVELQNEQMWTGWFFDTFVCFPCFFGMKQKTNNLNILKPPTSKNMSF